MEAAPPPPVQMMQMLSGFQISQGLYVTAKLGIADQLLDGPRVGGRHRRRSRC